MKREVRIEPMPDNPVRDEIGLGHRTGLYQVEIWDGNEWITAKDNLPYDEAKQLQFELLNPQ
jgi:hypothetical protein